MKNLKLLILALGVLMVSCGVALAANSTDTSGAQVDGDPVHTLSITGDTLSYTDPGDAGPQTYTMSGGPVSIVLTDNDFEPSADFFALTGKIITALPYQYNVNYKLRFAEGATWTPAADNEATGLQLGYGNIGLAETPLMGAYIAEYSGKIFHGTFEHNIELLIMTDKRVYGNTNDSYTIQYTFYDH